MTLAEMTAEIDAVNKANGWFDEERTFGDLIALLHSEVSEALEAYRSKGLEAWWTIPLANSADIREPAAPTKPEGVGSEFADILIRLLDMCSRFGIDLARELESLAGRFGIPRTFGDQITVMHLRISYAYMAWEEEFKIFDDTGQALAKIYVYLGQLCEHHGIDLEAEYRQKIAYNKTRGYRHGGKKL